MSDAEQQDPNRPGNTDSEDGGDSSEREEPKIIVDSDWKEQVEREKEAADAEPSKDSAVVDSDVSPGPDDGEDTPHAPPPASFEVLVSMLFTQAMATLGQMPDPATGKKTINKPFAKHYIDTLDMLGEKTEGNLNEQEAQMLSEALHALRMMYVNVRT